MTTKTSKGTRPEPLGARLDAIAKTASRSRFQLSGRERTLAETLGETGLRWYTYDRVARRIGPAKPAKDGKQTPYRGHPVFVAQHATGTCCRDCLEELHGIAKGNQLDKAELNYVVNVICLWLTREIGPVAKPVGRGKRVPRSAMPAVPEKPARPGQSARSARAMRARAQG
ncbi:DUF4186 family protein [Streptomyces sp. SID3343]|uniref:DUF4186 family protein n=1 Tax=Streptomyces sp. SID3343 TaxID=2690260 RepID=UPI00136EB09F|nr:DUF4186 family protein [Streptomyces sp. SID3343]MYV97694.1 DUF4186 family protein [Streptomyces sp. SID3343]